MPIYRTFTPTTCVGAVVGSPRYEKAIVRKLGALFPEIVLLGGAACIDIACICPFYTLNVIRYVGNMLYNSVIIICVYRIYKNSIKYTGSSYVYKDKKNAKFSTHPICKQTLAMYRYIRKRLVLNFH